MKTLLKSILPLAAALLTGCSLFTSFTDEQELSSLSFDVSTLSLDCGEMEIIRLTASPESKQGTASITWEYDSSVVSAETDNYSMILTGLAAGTAVVRASDGDCSATCVVTVSSDTYSDDSTSPYVYTSTDVVSLKTGGTARISASLYGGTSADASGYTWSIDKTSVASITAEANYCSVVGEAAGVAQIKVKHSKAPYYYTVLVIVSDSGATVPYITTDSNIITMEYPKTTKASFSVGMVSPSSEGYQSTFSWSVVDSSYNDFPEGGAPVSIDASGQDCTVTASSKGDCYIKVTNTAAGAYYPLYVLVRVVQPATNTYISVASTLVTLTGSDSQTLSVSLSNLADGAVDDPDCYSWNLDSCGGCFTAVPYGGSLDLHGNYVNLTPVKAGAGKIVVSNTLCTKSRTIIVQVRDNQASAADATCYISTSQNYIRTYVGADPVCISVLLNNTSSGGTSQLGWSIYSDAADGASGNVVEWDIESDTTGTLKGQTSARAASALQYSEAGYGWISPVRAGTAVITLSHPDALYDTKINVTVLPASAAASTSVYLTASAPVLYCKAGSSVGASVVLSGGTGADPQETSWSSDSAAIDIAADGCTATITSSETGLATDYVSVSHPAASNSLRILLVTYTSESELSALKLMYAAGTFFTVNVGDSVSLPLITSNFGDTDTVSWSCTSGENTVASVAVESRTLASVTGLSAGIAVIKASSTGLQDVVYTVVVKAAGEVDSSEPMYLTTAQNVVYLDAPGSSSDILVTPVNILPSCYSKATSAASTSSYKAAAADGSEVYLSAGDSGFDGSVDVISLSSNTDSTGIYLTVTALAYGSATVAVSIPGISSNTLQITVQVGNQYLYKNEDFSYISCADTLDTSMDSSGVVFRAVIANTADSTIDTGSLTFSTEDTGYIKVVHNAGDSWCNITPLKAGEATLRVGCSGDASVCKDVLVLIASAAADSSSAPYLTTSQNISSVQEGGMLTLTAALQNYSASSPSSEWHWSSTDTSIIQVVSKAAASCMVSGVAAGTAQIVCSNDRAANSLSFTVICYAASASAAPYILLSSNIETLAAGGSATVTADMVGGGDAYDAYFSWTCNDTSVAFVRGSGSSCFVKGLSAGCTYVTVTNSYYSSAYSKRFLVYVDASTDASCYIKCSSSIIKLKPTDSAGASIKADLVNGGATDAENFTWWCDNYSLLAMTSVTDTCSVTPLGLTGTTKIHVKHPKSTAVYDIVVIVSSCTELSFAASTKELTSGSFYYIGMNVPVYSEASSVSYTSDNPAVAVATGTDAVCIISGISPGTATITATQTNSDTGATVGTASCVCTCEAAASSEPEFSTDSTSAVIDKGSSSVLSASVSGSMLPVNADLGLRWWLKYQNVTDPSYVSSYGAGLALEVTTLASEGDADYAEFYDATCNNGWYALGAKAPVTAKYSGSYILTCWEPSTGASLDFFVVVPDMGAKKLVLDHETEYVTKGDDTSFTLNASISNGLSSDYKNVTWTASRPDGIKIVECEDTNGVSCDISICNVGFCQITAALPDGTSDSCVCVVTAAASIKFDTTSVHIIPGRTVALPYTITPSGAVPEFFKVDETATSATSTAAAAFTCTADTANSTLYITGGAGNDGAERVGYILCYIKAQNGLSSTQNASLDIFVENKIKFGIVDSSVKPAQFYSGGSFSFLLNDSTVTNNSTDDTLSFDYYYYPALDDVSVSFTTSDESALYCLSNKFPSSSGTKTVNGYLCSVGHAEFKAVKPAVSVTITGTCSYALSSTASYSTGGTAKMSGNILYSRYSITPYSSLKTGAFSYIPANKSDSAEGGYALSSNELTLGDGESFTIYFKPDQGNASLKLSSFGWSPSSGTAGDTKSLVPCFSNYADMSEDGIKSSYSSVATYDNILSSASSSGCRNSTSANTNAGGKISVSIDSENNSVTVSHIRDYLDTDQDTHAANAGSSYFQSDADSDGTLDSPYAYYMVYKEPWYRIKTVTVKADFEKVRASQNCWLCEHSQGYTDGNGGGSNFSFFFTTTKTDQAGFSYSDTPLYSDGTYVYRLSSDENGYYYYRPYDASTTSTATLSSWDRASISSYELKSNTTYSGFLNAHKNVNYYVAARSSNTVLDTFLYNLHESFEGKPATYCLYYGTSSAGTKSQTIGTLDGDDEQSLSGIIAAGGASSGTAAPTGLSQRCSLYATATGSTYSGRSGSSSSGSTTLDAALNNIGFSLSTGLPPSGTIHTLCYYFDTPACGRPYAISIYDFNNNPNFHRPYFSSSNQSASFWGLIDTQERAVEFDDIVYLDEYTGSDSAYLACTQPYAYTRKDYGYPAGSSVGSGTSYHLTDAYGWKCQSGTDYYGGETAGFFGGTLTLYFTDYSGNIVGVCSNVGDASSDANFKINIKCRECEAYGKRSYTMDSSGMQWNLSGPSKGTYSAVTRYIPQ